MGQPKLLEPGTVVKFRGNPLGYRNRYAIVIKHGGSANTLRLQTEGSDDALVARHEVAVARNPPTAPLKFMRHRLPYGKWTCADGREVLFNRNYKPIWERRPGGTTEPANSAERVKFVQQEWFYDDTNQPWRRVQTARKCNALLAEWGAAEI
jgi:hypothetical protein